MRFLLRSNITAVFVATWFCLWANSAVAILVEEVPNPRQNSEWVSDTANIISPSEQSRLNALIEELNASHGVEIAVVSVAAAEGVATPKDFATDLFNNWGIGARGKNDGLLVLMVVGERRLEMESGYGLEPILTDGWLKAMQQAEMVPRFKEGRFGVGLLAGVKASADRIRVTYENGGEPPMSAYDDETPGDGSWLLWLLFGGGGLGVAGVGGTAWSRKRERTCLTCENEMTLLDEEADDEFLTEGQQLEEGIGSVDYKVYWCEPCQDAKIVPKSKIFSGYKRCPSCGLKTKTANTTTVSIATEYSSGLQRVYESCANCDYENSYTRVIPRVVSSSNSSSSGGFGGGSSGGFSGGSSGGGGAGSSW